MLAPRTPFHRSVFDAGLRADARCRHPLVRVQGNACNLPRPLSSIERVATDCYEAVHGSRANSCRTMSAGQLQYLLSQPNHGVPIETRLGFPELKKQI